MMFGVPSKGAKLDLDMSKIYSKEITLVTSYAASDKDTAKALSLIESSQIDVKQLVTHTYTIDDTQKAFDHARSGDKAMKIIITK
jgi:L-iditol 2-dehydrogenase